MLDKMSCYFCQGIGTTVAEIGHSPTCGCPRIYEENDHFYCVHCNGTGLHHPYNREDILELIKNPDGDMCISCRGKGRGMFFKCKVCGGSKKSPIYYPYIINVYCKYTSKEDAFNAYIDKGKYWIKVH
jgi:hypothetical protein